MSDSHKKLGKPNEVIPKSKWRNYYLGLLAIGTNLLAVYVLFHPTAGNNSVAKFEFPQQIKLSAGKLITSPSSIQNNNSSLDLLKATVPEQEIVTTKQKYRYIQDELNIGLKMSYLVNTRGDVESYLKQYTKIVPEAIASKKISRIESTGYHALVSDRDQAYLSTCVSPRSLSSVTQQQFSNYRYQNDLNFQTAWEWLQGKSSIRDRRCLWIHMSIPLAGDSQTAYKTLETAWQEIYPWLAQNFPAL